MLNKLINEDGRYDGLEPVDSAFRITKVTVKGSLLTAILDRPVPDEIADAQGQANHRLVLEQDGQVRSFVAKFTGASMVVDDEHVPKTFEALKGAEGTSLHFFRLE